MVMRSIATPSNFDADCNTISHLIILTACRTCRRGEERATNRPIKRPLHRPAPRSAQTHIERAFAAMADVGYVEAEDADPEFRQAEPQRHLAPQRSRRPARP